MTDKSEEDAILDALRDPKWDYRTVEGVAKETKLSIERVRNFLESRTDLVWKSSVPDRKNRDLYTALSRKAQSKEFWRTLSTFMSKTSG